MVFTYKYPRPMVTVDVAVFRYVPSGMEILLIQRKHPPFAGEWALPGGFIKPPEKLHQAACRELHEETGLQQEYLFPLVTADDPRRDPRGRTISFAFGCILSPPFPEAKGADDAASAAWHPVSKLPGLAFDHQDFIRRILEHLQFDLKTRFLQFAFLPRHFSYSDWEKLNRESELLSDESGDWVDIAVQKGLLRITGKNVYERSCSLQLLYETDRFN